MSKLQVMRRMVGLVRPLILPMCIAVLTGVLGFVCAIAIPVLGALSALALAAAGPTEAHVPYLGWSLPVAFGVLMAAALLRSVLHYIEQRCNHYIAFRLLAHIRDLVFGTLRRLAPAKLSGKHKGELISAITSDIELLEVFYAHTISPICIAFCMTIILAVMFYLLNPWFMLVALIAYATVGVIIPFTVSRLAGAKGARSRAAVADLSSFVLENLRGLADVLQFAAGPKRLTELDERSKQLLKAQGSLNTVSIVGEGLIVCAVTIFPLIQIALGVHLFALSKVSVPAVVLSSVLMLSSFAPFMALARLGSSLQQTLASGERILAILAEKPQVKEVAVGANPQDPAYTGLVIDLASFRYASSEAQTTAQDAAGSDGSQQIVDKVSLQVKPGEIIGITGKSGSGKSTLCRLIMRFWDVDSGSIALSGHTLPTIETSKLRETEALVEQTTHLFHNSIRDNLLLARPDATEEDLIAACKAASIYDFIQTLPQGFDTMVSELGTSLSGGERQRIGLARAFLHSAPLIMLDEPTSNLDALNEARILASLVEQKHEHSFVLISHRSSTMAIVDRTYSMDSGRMS